MKSIVSLSVVLILALQILGEPFDPELHQKMARTYSPEESMAMMEIQDGYRLELVASEPMLEEPACMAWDGDGKLYVAELNTYMQDIDGNHQEDRTCRVVLLEDTDHDGVMDKRSVFIDNLLMPRMIQPLDGRVIIRETHTFDLYLYQDTDGDGVADEKKLVFDGGPRGGNLEHQPSGLEWNIDNWMYVTYTNRRYRWNGDHIEAQDIPGGSGQWGVTHDDVGRNFFCVAGGENPAMDFQIPLVYGKLSLPGEQAPGFREVFPLVGIPDVQGGPGRFRADSLTLNHFTGCAGQHIFRGDRLSEDFYGDYIIPEAVGRLVRRAKVNWDQGKRVLTNAYPGSEFIRSRDANFRPVTAATGPDGCLYILDMYRGIIQEGNWVRPGSYLREVVEKYGMDKNIGRGRLYRVVREGVQRGPSPKMLKAPSSELVAYLDHPNGWWRDMAQKLLVIRQDTAVRNTLETMVRESSHPLGRLHALWTLDGLGLSDPALLKDRAKADTDPRVRAAAIRISEPFLAAGTEAQTAEWAGLLAGEAHLDVVNQWILSLAYSSAPGGDRWMEEIRKRYTEHPTVTAILGHNKQRMEEVRRRREQSEFMVEGERNFKTICVACHGLDGKGTSIPGLASMTLGAPLDGSPRVQGKKDVVIKILLKGMMGELDGKRYPGPMLPLESYDDRWLASVLTYVRKSWNNKASDITSDDVAAVRATVADRREMWLSSEIKSMTPVSRNEMSEWTFSASHNSNRARAAVDGNPNTRWDTGQPQKDGMWFAIDLGKPREVISLVLDTRGSKGDYPRIYSVQYSEDGENWGQPTAQGAGSQPVIEILLPGKSSRYLRINQGGIAPGTYWSIHELEVYLKP